MRLSRRRAVERDTPGWARGAPSFPRAARPAFDQTRVPADPGPHAAGERALRCGEIGGLTRRLMRVTMEFAAALEAHATLSTCLASDLPLGDDLRGGRSATCNRDTRAARDRCGRISDDDADRDASLLRRQSLFFPIRRGYDSYARGGGISSRDLARRMHGCESSVQIVHESLD
jgi:hypothetical protein